MTLLIGDYEAADKLITTARSLDPYPPACSAFVEGRNLLFSGRYEEAEAVSLAGPEFVSTFVIRCLAQSLLGKVEDARRTHDQILSRYPGFCLASYPQSMGIIAETALETFGEAVSRLHSKP